MLLCEESNLISSARKLYICASNSQQLTVGIRTWQLMQWIEYVVITLLSIFALSIHVGAVLVQCMYYCCALSVHILFLVVIVVFCLCWVFFWAVVFFCPVLVFCLCCLCAFSVLFLCFICTFDGVEKTQHYR
jgi:hypothetical protein